MIRLMSVLGVLCLLLNPCAATAAANAGANSDAGLAQQIKQMQKQLRDMQDEIGKLSGRLEKIEALIPSPKPPQKVNVRLGKALRLGDPKAKLGIVEFSDYQCPYCRRFYLQTFPQLQKSYIDSGKLALLVKNFPLDFHPHAMNAALAMNCFGDQDANKFWDIQHELFSHQDRLGQAFYKELVKKYGLNQKKFESCVGDAAQRKRVNDDLKYAQSLGVQGTPTFFIGRIQGDQLVDATPVVGAQPYPVFEKIIDSLTKQKDKAL